MTSARSVWRRTFAAVTVAALLFPACSRGDDDDADTTDDSTTTTIPSSVPVEPRVTVSGETPDDASPQLDVSLGEGTPSDGVPSDVELVDGAPLDDDTVTQIIDALPTWNVPDDDVPDDDFNRPPQTLPPPLVGETNETPFPPPDDPVDPGEAETGPLEVLRFQPEGDVDVAPFLSVTFNQPMVPVGTLDQLDTADVPVELTPAIEGRWRWIGTRTLRFELVPDQIDRLPAATEYRAEVPAGTTAANGATLADTVSWTFATPPPSVVRFVAESDSLPLEPVFVAEFDQRVVPDDVLATISVRTGDDELAIRLATVDEIAADERAAAAVDSALDARTVAFRPVDALPVDTALTIEIGPGTPSAEGPRTSEEAVTFSARTFGALRVIEHRCGYDDDCVPGSPFVLAFSNALDPDAFEPDQVSVSPEIPGLRVNVSGSSIELIGATVGRTTYTVDLAGELQDVFGQTLGDDQSFEFDVGPARPALIGFDREFVTVDPATDDKTVSVTTVNHDSVHVTAWGVTPTDLPAFREYYDAQWSDTDPVAPEWPVVIDEEVAIDADPDEIVETAIDLTSAFDQVGSQLVVRIESTESYAPDDDDYWQNLPSIAWVQSTTLGIDAFFDTDELLIWTTDLLTGEPIGGVPVELLGDGRVATTDEEGVAQLELGDAGITGLYATSGDRIAFMPSSWFEGWTEQIDADEGRWYVFDDRGIYRPGENVRMSGWVRNMAWSDGAQLALFEPGDGGAPDDLTVDFIVTDPQGNEIAAGSAPLNALGGFNFDFDIPEGSNLGQAWVDLRLIGLADGQSPGAGHTFQIQEFRRPDFEVTTRTTTEPPFYAAEPATVAVDATYYSGGPLPDAPVDWLVTTRETSYSPPNWDDFTFGIWQPWFFYDGSGGGAATVDSASDFAGDVCFDCGPVGGEAEYEEFSGRTDADGSHYLDIDFSGPDVDLPSTVTAEATVFDVNRQAWSSRTDLLVHPAEYYVGLRSDRTFVEQGTPLRIDAVVTDVDGNLVEGRDVTVTAGRLEWAYTDEEWNEDLVDPQTCTVTSTDDATDGSMQCDFTTDVGGTYQITAVVVDDDDHSNRTQITQWVTGGTSRPTRTVDEQPVTLVPDRETYAPGDTAEVLVQAPFAPAYGLMTVIRHGIVSTEVFEAEDGSAVLEVPIADENIPNITLQVEMVGSAPRIADDGTVLPDAPEQPAYAVSQVMLSIPPVSRTLDVVATPEADGVNPGADTSVTVAVNGPDGAPVEGADVAVVVVDEAVLALTGYDLADPLDVFYTEIWPNLSAEYARSRIVLSQPDLLDGGSVPASTAPTAGGDGAATEDSAEAADDSGGANDYAGRAGSGTIDIDVRENFDALAVFAPHEPTGPDGTVTVDVPLPDTLTRYRVMAVAVDGADQFGKGESTITARLPLMVRPSAPRFLNFGDHFELPVVVQNQTDEPLTVDVVVETSNLRLEGSAGQTVTVPANDRVEVRFPATTEEVGTARYRVAAVSGDFADAATGEMPVYTPATAEAFATYGVIDGVEPIGQPVLAPTGVFPQFGGLEINTSSTALQNLTDAVIYLVDYPYESADAYASRIMAIAALRDVLEAFDAEGMPSPEELDAQVARDIERLSALQNDDGGFPYWTRGRESIPWESIQSTHALVIADQAGYAVPSGTLDAALNHLADIEDYIPAAYSQEVRDTLSAYALYVRNLAGQGDPAKAKALYERSSDTLQLDALAWLWPSITDETIQLQIAGVFNDRAVDTAGAVTFATDYGEDAYLIAESDRRTDGIILDSLITVTPDSDLIPKVVNGLMSGRTNGRWNNVQENAFILLAMRHYYDTFEAVTPEFVARAWLGPIYAAEQEFSGRTTDRALTVVPMDDLIGVGDTDLVLAKDGEGRLYYRLGLRYAPSDLELEARDEGFVVDRVYEGVDDPSDVTRDADGTWRIAAGANVRVVLTMVADARRTHVALVDPLPAGLEPVNPSLVVSQTIPPDETDGSPVEPSPRGWWGWNWFEHQNLRDDRVEAFTSYLPGGTYEYSYVARATTPGTFVVPPTRAEEIYAPETFGRTSSATVIVE